MLKRAVVTSLDEVAPLDRFIDHDYQEVVKSVQLRGNGNSQQRACAEQLEWALRGLEVGLQFVAFCRQ